MITKLAADTLKRLSYPDSLQVYQRATRRSPDGWGSLMYKRDLQELRKKMGLKNALGVGASGAVSGALLGLATKQRPGVGAALGGILGAASGGVTGLSNADKKYLSPKGIHPRWLSTRMDVTPEAMSKYLPEGEY